MKQKTAFVLSLLLYPLSTWSTYWWEYFKGTTIKPLLAMNYYNGEWHVKIISFFFVIICFGVINLLQTYCPDYRRISRIFSLYFIVTWTISLILFMTLRYETDLQNALIVIYSLFLIPVFLEIKDVIRSTP